MIIFSQISSTEELSKVIGIRQIGGENVHRTLKEGLSEVIGIGYEVKMYMGQ